MLKDRLHDLEMNEIIEEELIRSVRERAKREEALIQGNFLNREELRDKVFILLKDEIEERFPDSGLQVGEGLLSNALAGIFGLGVLEKYLQDRSITDIFIQDREMIVISNGKKKYLGEVFDTIEETYLIVDRIKNNSGKVIDQRVPFLNTELYDGSRCSIVIPPISDKVYISIRIFNCLDFKLEDLQRSGLFGEEESKMLGNFVETKKNILIAGSMGSGKTTLLNTLAKLIPKDDFINLIQDVPEIRLREYPYVRMLSTRQASREIDNEINQDRLLYETLRMKADRIIIGEVRDSMAAFQMLQALNTGHNGSFGTIHADTAADALLRLETLAMGYSINLSNHLIKKMISRAIDVVLFLEIENKKNTGDTRRKLKEILLIEDELDDRGEYKLRYL
ncbi:MAG: CpaF family protein [Actinobacteria bacterium]|nr:CpaF family protein [Actinomycetota bacterium]